MLKNNYLNWFVSLLFAYIYVYIIPWEELFGQPYTDLELYLARVQVLYDGLPEAVYTGLKWVMSEPLWKEVLLLIAEYCSDFKDGMFLISFWVVFVYFSFLSRRVPLYIAIIFLVNPMSVDLFMAQLRSVLAFSFVLIAYELSEREGAVSKILSITLLILAFFMHMSMPVFYGIYYAAYWVNQRVEGKKYYLFSIGLGVFVALFMKYGANIILLLIGDRHANYEEIIDATSVKYALIWILISSILATFGDFSDKKQRVVAGYAITVMSFFFFISVLNAYGARYVALSMPFIIISISYLPKHVRQGTYLLLFLFNLYAFKYWAKYLIV